jgi:hypothetical protein
LQRNYAEYFSNHIIPSDDFLEMNHKFLVLDSLEYDKSCTLDRTWGDFNCPQWLEKRILSNPLYKLTNLGPIDDNRTILLVEKH